MIGWNRPFNGWDLVVRPPWRKAFAGADDVLSLAAGDGTVLHDNERGLVRLVRVEGTRFVAKRSRVQERRRWSQLTSLYRGGEGWRAFSHMSALFDLGFNVPEPVLCLEKRVLGCVTVSWLLYRHVDGEPCTCRQSGKIASTLETLHRAGWVHRDPHTSNFLWDGSKISLIDCTSLRPWKSAYHRAYDLVRLDQCCPGSLERGGAMIALATLSEALLRRWRRVKRAVRNLLKIRRA